MSFLSLYILNVTFIGNIFKIAFANEISVAGLNRVGTMLYFKAKFSPNRAICCSLLFCFTERLCPFQNEKGESDKVDVTFWTKSLSQEKGEKLVLPPGREQGIQVRKLHLDPSTICSLLIMNAI